MRSSVSWSGRENRTGRLAGRTGGAGVVEERSRSPPATTCAWRRARRDEAVEGVDDGVAVLGADVGPDARVTGSDGSCPGSRRQRGAAAPGGRRSRWSARAMRVAAVRWGTCETMARGRRGGRRDRHHLGPGSSTRWSARSCRRSRPCGHRGEDPDRPRTGRAGPVHALLLGAGHGWLPTKRASSRARTIGPFTLPTSVTTPLVSASTAWGGRPPAPTGVATNVTPALGSPRRRRGRPARAPARPVPVEVDPAHVPALAAQGHPDRASR